MPYFYPAWLTLTLLACLALFWLEPPRGFSASVVVVAWLGLCWPALWLHYQRRQRPALEHSHICIAYASQSGQSRYWAQQTAAQLRQAGVACQLRALADIRPQDWPKLRTLLLLTSTYGEGEAPDHAIACEHWLKHYPGRLEQLSYAVLAFGDRDYAQFCAFGLRLDQRLSQLGGQPLHDCLQVNRNDPAVLAQWQQLLGQLADDPHYREWHAPPYHRATLLERQCLNPNGTAQPVYLIKLSIPAGCHWQAGDILELGPCNSAARISAFAQQHRLDLHQVQADGHTLDWHLARRQLSASPEQSKPLTAEQWLAQLPTLRHRDYSIASLPADGCIELLVRLHEQGCASHWLCQHAALGATLDVRIRSNPHFQLSEQPQSLILIGNGTGLAGLQAHLREREALGQAGHWLLFGERQAAHDHFYAAQHQRWQDQGHLNRLDLAFSRDQAERRYVQHVLTEHAQELQQRLANGASLLLCGSLHGMGEEVDALLQHILGCHAVQQLRDSGRYRRDLY